ncbi:MAG TPA: phosphoribosylamine--glycine ligase [Mycobacteriales bacterium]|nr:phosphoribosylamine--glycine ligase [Mycobacteriales bacterium]
MSAARVLVLGSGAREHALCLGLSQDPGVGTVVCAPGNAGTAAIAESYPVDLLTPAAVVALAEQVRADRIVVGPEGPLVAGVADALRTSGFEVFGPSAAAARIEGSKTFAKSVMTGAGVPTAGSWHVDADDDAGLRRVLEALPPPYVVKHDGLAAGKGVLVTDNLAAAITHGRGHEVLIETYLAGPEVSLFAVVTSAGQIVPLLPAQDHKRIGDGDTGPNTGGMGAYAPLGWAPDDLVDVVTRVVLEPTVAELARRGHPFTGLLYAGLALTSTGVKVVEFNARFGDPETQVLLALLQTPLTQLLFEGVAPRWHDRSAVTVVLAAPGYPTAPALGGEVTGPLNAPGVLHAGTRREADGTVVASGGRVLSVTAVGSDLRDARGSAYDLLAQIHLPGGQFRTDIGYQGVH